MTLFTGSHTDSITWDATKQDEAISTLKTLHIRPKSLTIGYCQVSYDAYTKLRMAGAMTHRIGGE